MKVIKINLEIECDEYNAEYLAEEVTDAIAEFAPDCFEIDIEDVEKEK